MAKKQIKQSEQKSSKQKTKLSLQKIVIGVFALAVIGFFIVNNFITNEPKVEYYTFTKEGELTFTDSLGTLKAKIDLEIADNEYERQLGLMNRKEMKENEGMLFIFPRQDYQSFWMRNTLISLDIMFVNDQKEIVTIHKNTKILSETSYPSSAPSIYVVETLAGFADRHNIQVGDKIDWMGTRIGL
ncbi:MAG: hypothetical protein H6Q27_1124 [Ignavibacteriaceae bacterium]|jgi:hypothetical protein|nr:hypothetical protein [Ignavibacteriaceae bacterium]